MHNLHSIWAIAKITLIEQIRNRLYLIIVFFGGIILLSSLLLGQLAPGHTPRVIFDLGLVSIELFALAAAVFGAVTLITQEMESKTIYLILSRPLPRVYYVLGRFLGFNMAVALTMLVMAFFHLVILLTQYSEFKTFSSSFPFWSSYPILVFMSIAKIFVTISIALFFSLFASSSVSALVFTSFFWVSGHFSSEISFLMKNISSDIIRYAFKFISWVLPNFHYFNFRDHFSVAGFSGYSSLGWVFLYSVGYAGFFLSLSTYLFSKKEF
ncbi:MAG: ABC transporter permease [Elusimicrobiota bacterium]